MSPATRTTTACNAIQSTASNLNEISYAAQRLGLQAIGDELLDTVRLLHDLSADIRKAVSDITAERVRDAESTTMTMMAALLARPVEAGEGLAENREKTT